MTIGDRIKVLWFRNYNELCSEVEIVKINRKSVKAKVMTCDGPIFMRGKVLPGEVITLSLPLRIEH